MWCAVIWSGLGKDEGFSAPPEIRKPRETLELSLRKWVREYQLKEKTGECQHWSLKWKTSIGGGWDVHAVSGRTRAARHTGAVDTRALVGSSVLSRNSNSQGWLRSLWWQCRGGIKGERGTGQEQGRSSVRKQRSCLVGERNRLSWGRGESNDFIKYSGRAEVGPWWSHELRPNRRVLDEPQRLVPFPERENLGGGREAEITDWQEARSWLCIHCLILTSLKALFKLENLAPPKPQNIFSWSSVYSYIVNL